MTLEEAVNAEIFRSYVRKILLPELNAGDILVMDNLSAHKDGEALELLAIGEALSRITQKDATYWFAHCGYGFI